MISKYIKWCKQWFKQRPVLGPLSIVLMTPFAVFAFKGEVIQIAFYLFALFGLGVVVAYNYR